MKALKENSRVLLVGMGYRTGLAAANFLAGKGHAVFASDIKSGDDLRDVIAKLDARVTLFAGNQSPEILDRGFDLIVLSPGVPRNIPLIAEAGRRGVPVIAEIELAYRFIKGKIIGITGTDGKSTTTCLVGHILKELGADALVGGNIGIPLISLVEKTKEDSVSVVELSSFQLETIESFRPHVAAILNVTPDHLDRYAGMEDYFAAKMRIASNQTAEDAFVYNADDAVIAGGLGGVKAGKLSFSLSDAAADASYDGKAVRIREGGTAKRVLDPSRMKIVGMHNIQNAMAAMLMVASVLRGMNIAPDYEKMAAACCSFPGLPHRMEPLGEYGGRAFINDSKATTVGAVEMALKGMDGNCVLIMGGRTKGDDYSRLARSMEGRIKALVLIGESAPEFEELFRAFPQERAGSLDDAVVKAMKASGKGDVILLSPACASFDMFRNYEERGDMFRLSLRKLREGVLSWT